MNLSKSFTQYNSKGQPASSLSIEVDYDPGKGEVAKIIGVGVLDYHTGRLTDITKVMADLFDLSLGLVVDNIDWAREYADSRKEVEA